MIDIKQIRAEPAPYAEAAQRKNFGFDIDRLLEVDGKLLDAQRELQDLRTEQNRAGKEIAKLKGDEKQAAIQRMSELKARAKELDEQVQALEPEFRELMLRVPQPPDPDVPLGADDTENVELRRVGEIPEFDFEPKDHVELGEQIGRAHV